ncbi:MAG: hypothetical protein KatS3mg008_0209 [Acidimicrobiales bacterium]|nr:MAG: hypothetical protein KatS3mg008_0209 [Acidimicrobiales bacterium]
MTAVGMVHRLPPARVVDRIEFILDLCRGKRVVHLGCADHGFRREQLDSGTFLHSRLAEVSRELVGLDLDREGVEEMRSMGWDVHLADCTDGAQVRRLELEPADVVVAGELLEHVERPGDLLDAVAPLVAEGGRLVITTPNAYGWVNPFAALARVEINHPEHLHMFTARTLTALLSRHGWDVETISTYVPRLRASLGSTPGRGRVLWWAARTALAFERLVARTVSPYVADGLIVVARSSGR